MHTGVGKIVTKAYIAVQTEFMVKQHCDTGNLSTQVQIMIITQSHNFKFLNNAFRELTKALPPNCVHITDILTNSVLQ